jgi:hypothetical protein
LGHVIGNMCSASAASRSIGHSGQLFGMVIRMAIPLPYQVSRHR